MPSHSKPCRRAEKKFAAAQNRGKGEGNREGHHPDLSRPTQRNGQENTEVNPSAGSKPWWGERHTAKYTLTYTSLRVPNPLFSRVSEALAPADIDPAAEASLARLLGRLYELQPEAGDDGQPTPAYIGLASDAKRLFVNFYNAHGAEQVDLAGELAAAWSKLEGYAARLALIVHYARWAADDDSLQRPDQVDADSMRRAVILTEWFKAEARRVYGVLAESDEQRERRQLLEWLRGKGGAVTARELQQGPRQYRGSTDAAETALQELVKAGLGTWQDLPTTDRGGRPGRVFQLANGGYGYTTPMNPEQNRGSVAVASVATPKTQDCDWGEV